MQPLGEAAYMVDEKAGQPDGEAGKMDKKEAGQMGSDVNVIDADEVRRLAESAKIWLSDEEITEIGGDLARWYKQADEAFARETWTAACEGAPAPLSALRADIPRRDVETETLLEQSPSDGYEFVIPQLIE